MASMGCSSRKESVRMKNNKIKYGLIVSFILSILIGYTFSHSYAYFNHQTEGIKLSTLKIQYGNGGGVE